MLNSDSTASPDVVLGGKLIDSATLAGGVKPTGTLSFRAYGPDDANCTGVPAFTSAVAVSGNGTYRSAEFAPAQPGVYRWVVSYSGDANNDPVAGACNEAQESAIVASAEEHARPGPPSPKIHATVTNYTARSTSPTCPRVPCAIPTPATSTCRSRSRCATASRWGQW